MGKTDFEKFALSKGVGSHLLSDYVKNMYVNPTVIEERQMNVTSIDIFSRMLIDRILFLGTEINDDVANIFSAQLLWLEQQSDKDITIHIASPGGSIYSGYQILDTMEFINPEISTVSMGMVASMAAVIASSGTKGKRFILPHARFLVHQPLGGTSGQCSDIQIKALEIQKLKEELTRILAENSGQPYDKMEKMCDRDTILTAQEAVDYGFVDSTVLNRKNRILP